MIKNPIILVCSHKKFNILQNEILKPIQVGAIGKESLYNLRDDLGDNISAKNEKFCELTAMYWAWKNLPSHYDYVGFFHYRRYLSFRVERLYKRFFPKIKFLSYFLHKFNEENILKLCNDYDILMIQKESFTSNYILNDSTLERFKNFIQSFFFYNKELQDIFLNILFKKYPQSKNYTNELLFGTSHRGYFYSKNMFIMKREYFNQYMNFLFDVLFELENELNLLHNQHLPQNRRFGYIAELMINIFLNSIITSKPTIKELHLIKAFNLDLSNTYFKKQFYKIKERLNINYIKFLFFKLKGK